MANSNPNADVSRDVERYNKRLMNTVVRCPLVIADAQGSTIHDVENNRRLLDYWGDEGVCSLGMNTPEFNKAVLKFMAGNNPHRLPDVYPHELRWKAAELICTKTGMDRLFYANSGTEANEAAIKLARKFWWDTDPVQDKQTRTPKRHVILTVEGNFHGRTGFAMASGDCRVSPYHRWGYGPIAKGFGVINHDYKQVVTDGEEHEPREPNWSEVAGIILAPVLGNNCVKVYPREFWEGLARIREQHGVLLIYDDVQAGSGRAGQFATWQDESCRVKPDIMSLAKGIAMGFPASVMLASERVAQAFTPGVHFNTFGGSPFICHMMIEFYTWLEQHIQETREKGAVIRQAWSEMDFIKEHDGMGMLNAFTPDYQRFGYDGFQYTHAARELGLSIITHRQFGAIRFTPPLNTPMEEIQKALSILKTTHMKLVAEGKTPHLDFKRA